MPETFAFWAEIGKHPLSLQMYNFYSKQNNVIEIGLIVGN